MAAARAVLAGLLVMGLAIGASTAGATRHADPAGRERRRLHRESDGPVDRTTTAAPWSVLIKVDLGNGSAVLCTGSIIDPTHVLTAAHCTTDENSGQMFPLGDYTVTAGIVSTLAGSDRSSEQQAGVAAVSDFPGYVAGGGSQGRGDDIAELTLSAPLAITPEVTPIPVVGPGDEPALGSSGIYYGWGESTTISIDGSEHFLPFVFGRSTDCSSGFPSVLCGASSVADACAGDSGSGVTAGGSLVGVVDFTRPVCTAGDPFGYTDLASPEIQEWLHGAPVHLAPRTSSFPMLTGRPIAGAPLTCAAPSWVDGANTGYAFVDQTSGVWLQNGPKSTYAIAQSSVGHSVLCVAEATSDGGVTDAVSQPTKTIGPSPSPELVLNIRHGVMTATAATALVSVPITLTITAPNGRRVLDTRFPDTSPYRRDLAHSIPPGRYQVCLTSPQTEFWAPGSTCQRYVLGGTTSGLITRIHSRRTSASVIFTANIPKPLEGRPVTISWYSVSVVCCQRPRLLTRRVVRLRAITRLVEPRTTAGPQYLLTLALPSVQYQGVRLRGGRATLTYRTSGPVRKTLPLG